jgi:hypothetical protein
MTLRHRAALALTCLVLFAAAAAAAPQITAGPYLQNVTQTSITVMWETGEPADSRVDYGLTADYGQHAASAQPAKIHEVTLTGLQPETRYHYRVASTGAASDDATFDTAIQPATPFRFCVWGDSQSHPEVFGPIAAAMAKEQPRLAVCVGDSVSDGEDYAQWKERLFDPAAPLMRTAPVYVAIGNHEKNSHWFYDYLSYPAPEDYYAFTYGNSRFVIVDTQQDYAPQSAQYRWLEKELASPEAQNATWLFAFHHKPGYCEGWDSIAYDGEEDVRRHLMPLFEKYAVDLVFNGHAHDYERGFMNGVHYIISGGGGGTLDHWVRGLEHVAVSRSAHHYCTVDIAGRELTLRAITPSGELLDTITLRKRPVHP